MENNKPASAPRGAADATPAQAQSGQSTVPWWVSLRQGLQLTSQLVIASPVRLPAKVIAAAKYVSLALGIWQSFEPQPEAEPVAVAEGDGGEGPLNAP